MQHFFCERCKSNFSSGPELERHTANAKISGCPLTDEDAVLVTKAFMRLQLDGALSSGEWSAMARVISASLSEAQERLIQTAIQEVLDQRRAKP